MSSRLMRRLRQRSLAADENFALSVRQHRRALEAARAQIVQGFIRLFERIDCRRGLNVGFWRYGQEFDRVAAGQIGDGDELALLP